MPFQPDKFDEDEHLFSQSLEQSKRPHYADDKLSREIYVITAGTADAFGAIRQRLPEVAVEVAASVATGFALRAAEAKLPWLRPGLAIGAVALTASAIKDLVKPAGEIASTLSDTWRSADNLEGNRAKFAGTGGKFLVDLAVTTTAGLAGSALANRTLFGAGSNYVRINTYEPASTYVGEPYFRGPRARLYNLHEPDAASFLAARESSVFLTSNKIPGGQHRYSANGFFASEDGLIVTNHHVVAGKIEISAKDYSGTIRKARVVAMNGAEDLAVLKIESEQGFKPLRFAKEAAQPGDRVLPVSHQYAVKGLTIGPGRIESIEQMPIRVKTEGTSVKVSDPASYNASEHTFKFSTELQPGTNQVISERFFGNYFSKPGASGSPLLNSQGEVVAVLSGGMDGKNYAIPTKAIEEILANARKLMASK